MRKRKEIEKDGSKLEILTLEVLLDIRDILVKATKKGRGGRPKMPTKTSV